MTQDEFEKLNFECYLCSNPIEWRENFYTLGELNKNDPKFIKVNARCHENCYVLLPYSAFDTYRNNLDKIMFFTDTFFIKN